jgi:hypothetical protein
LKKSELLTTHILITNNMNLDNINTMVGWEQRKAFYLIQIAQELGMNISGYGEIGVNNNSGYTYLWLEDYMFTLFMPIHCELTKTDVWAIWSNPSDGTEEEMELESSTTLQDLQDWAEQLYSE